MKIETDQGVYTISWKYFHGSDAITAFSMLPEKERPKLCFKKKQELKDKISDITVCEIYKEDETWLIQKYIFCSTQDIFNKETGRKLSLTKALQPFNRRFRTAVWKTYFNRKK